MIIKFPDGQGPTVNTTEVKEPGLVLTTEGLKQLQQAVAALKQAEIFLHNILRGGV